MVAPSGTSYREKPVTGGYTSARMPADEPKSLNDVGKNVGAAYAAAMAYLSVQIARAQAIVRSVVLFAILAVIAGVVLTTVLVVATVLLVSGIAETIANLLGGRQWAGDLITGATIIFVVAVGGFLIVSRMANAAKLRTMSSYQKKL